MNNPWWTSKLHNQRKEIQTLKKQNTTWFTEARNILLREKIKSYKRDCLKAKKTGLERLQTQKKIVRNQQIY